MTLSPCDLLDEILVSGLVHSVYQPIVDLATGGTVAYEALARGPEGSSLERPDDLFAAAHTAGRLDELDWACRAAALQGALDAGLGNSTSLFINVEPAALRQAPPDHLMDLFATASRELHVVVEVTERALVAAPAALLDAVTFVRDLGFSLALDDVGAETASLALMPFLRPDVIKLDLKLIQERPDRDVAAVVGAVDAHAERTGAVVLAEGIETEAHRQTALGMGATLGQGWLFAKPGPLGAGPAARGGLVGRSLPDPIERSPYQVAAAGRMPRRATKPLLLEMSRHLERQALDQGEAVVVLGAFQQADRFTPETRQRYAILGERAAFVAAIGLALNVAPAPGVRGATILPGDPLVDEWTVSVVGPHFAAALAAVDLGDTGPDCERRFDYVLTYDRDLAVGIARSLMARVEPV